MNPSANDAPYLTVKNLCSQSHAGIRFTGIDLQLKKGRLYGVIGQNGSGKTSLLKALCGLIPSTAEQLSLAGDSFSKWNVKKRAQHLTWLSSENFLAFEYTPLELMKLFRNGVNSFLPSQNNKDIFAAELKYWDMHRYINTPISRLSSGQRQLIFIAAAIVRGTDCFVFDEPCIHLDLTMSRAVHQRLHDLAHKEEKLVIFSTHDIEASKKSVDEIIALKKGRLVAAGPVNEILTEKYVNDIFFS